MKIYSQIKTNSYKCKKNILYIYTIWLNIQEERRWWGGAMKMNVQELPILGKKTVIILRIVNGIQILVSVFLKVLQYLTVREVEAEIEKNLIKEIKTHQKKEIEENLEEINYLIFLYFYIF